MAVSNHSPYIIYLRKSRADNPTESIEEVLEKHESMLQELAQRDLGGRIPDEYIIREVVSGETIDERPGIQRVLAMIENPEIKSVLVVDCSRLSRGDLTDCGKIVTAFRYTQTEVITLNMTYDLSNKMQRKFFEQELMRGNDYLEYTKEILLRGRIASVKRGNYIGNTPPFGFDKIRIAGEPSLAPNDSAQYVSMIFDMYVNKGAVYSEIGAHLDAIGVKPLIGERWQKCSIREILRNPHYAGYVRFGYKHTETTYEDGQTVKRRSRPSHPDEMLIVKGKHQAIISEEIFAAAQERLKNNPKAAWDAPLKNPFSGVFFCHKCGRAITQHPYKHARDRFECRNKKECGSKSAPMDEVTSAVIHALAVEHLPALEAKLNSNAGTSAEIQKKQIKKMQDEFQELAQQENKQYELLEKGFYTEEKFVERNTALHRELDDLKSRIYTAKQTMPKEIDYAGKIVKLKEAIAAMKNDSITIKEKNKFVREIIERIEYEYLDYKGKGKTIFALHITLLL